MYLRGLADDLTDIMGSSDAPVYSANNLPSAFPASFTLTAPASTPGLVDSASSTDAWAKLANTAIATWGQIQIAGNSARQLTPTMTAQPLPARYSVNRATPGYSPFPGFPSQSSGPQGFGMSTTTMIGLAGVALAALIYTRGK